MQPGPDVPRPYPYRPLRPWDGRTGPLYGRVGVWGTVYANPAKGWTWKQ